MEILPVRENDRSEILEISKNSFEWGDYIDEVFDLWLKNGIFIKAVENDKILGFIHIRIFKDFSWFEGLRVRIDARRIGVGTELTRKAIIISNKSVNRLMINAINKPSIVLSKKLDFREVNRFYYNESAGKDFDEILNKYGLKPLNEKLNENYVDEWVYFDKHYYKDFIYGNSSGLKLLKTSPPFILGGLIEEENFNKKNGSDLYIIFERVSP